MSLIEFEAPKYTARDLKSLLNQKFALFSQIFVIVANRTRLTDYALESLLIVLDGIWNSL